MAKSHSEQAGVLVLGKILATLSEAIVPLVIVRLLGKADVGILSGLMLVYSTVALVLTAGFPETLTFYLPTRSPAERRAITRNVVVSLALLGCVGSLVLVTISLIARFAPNLTHFGAAEARGVSATESLKYLALLAAYPIADLPGRMLPNLLIVEQRARALHIGKRLLPGSRRIAARGELEDRVLDQCFVERSQGAPVERIESGERVFRRARAADRPSAARSRRNSV